MRDEAISGLVSLASRQDWLSSARGPSIVAALDEAGTDANAVVRMHAARALPTLWRHLKVPEQVRRLEERLAREPEPGVVQQLLMVLHPLAAAAPSEVDELLRRRAVHGTDAGDTTDRDVRALRDLEVGLLTYLALAKQTPYATDRLDAWAREAHLLEEPRRVVRHIRNYLRAGSAGSQRRAFEFATSAATTCVAHFDQIVARHDGEKTLPTEWGEQLKRIHTTLDRIASQVYFASGAYDDKAHGRTAEVSAENERLAQLAIPLLITCSQTHAAPIVHHVAETLVYLSPLDQRRALLALSQAINPAGAYASDNFGSSVVVPHLKTLLADHRHLVLFDPDGVVAFRQLLTSFAAAGSEPALELVFTFSEVFR
jgi:hypothetical protein